MLGKTFVMAMLLMSTTAWGGTSQTVAPMLSVQDHVLALKSDGTVYAWGRNGWGELGDGTTADRASPGQVAGLSNVKSVLAAGESSFALKQDGTVFGWGVSAPSQSRTPVQLNGLSNVVAIAWGNNFFSLKADGTVQEGLDAVPVPGLASITAISGGGQWAHSLALKSDGTVWAWGRNYSGELGDGTTTKRTVPAQVNGLSGVVAISAGNGFSLALKSDGTVWAWGNNNTAQLGDGTTTNRLAPVQVKGLSNATAISAGTFSSAAIKTDGTVWDWGQSSIPGTVPNISNAKAVAAASNGFTIVLKSDGTLSTWGSDNTYGILGNGNFGGGGGKTNQVVSLNLSGGAAQNALPSAVFTMVPASSGGSYTVRCDAGNSTDTDGSIVGYAWTTSNGQTATGQTPTFSFNQAGSYSIGLTVTDNQGGTAQSSATVLLPQASATPAVAKGSGQVLAIKSDGTLLSWGSNEFGQLGTGKTSSSTIPVLVASLSGVKAIAGSSHSLALRQDGTVWAWGDNSSAELGNGSTSGRSLVPIKVSNLTDVKAIAAGWLQSLAAKSDGSVYEWGSNVGGVPSQVQGLSNVIAVAAGSFHKLALKGDGTVWVWGDNQYGQYGNGTVFVWGQYGNGHTTYSPVPVQVPGLQNITAIAAGSTYSLALQSDGSVWIWGDNRNGLLGTDTSSQVTPPIKVQGLNQVVAIAGGNLLFGTRPLALKADGTVYRFGYNSRTQIAGLQNISAISDGVALQSDGTVFTWDDNPNNPFNNSDGSFGNGTFARRDGVGLVVNQDASGYLDLIPEVPNNVIPPALKVPFFAVASGNVTGTNATVTTTTRFNAADVGKPGAVFVTAMVPSGSASAPSIRAKPLAAPDAKPLGATAANSYMMMQLTSSGWQQVTNGQLIPYATGVLGDQLAAQTILNNTATANLKGAQFCLGYGANATDMSGSGRMRVVATIPDPNATGTASCLQVSNAQLFAYAAGNYPSLFSGAVTGGTYQQYDYKHYSSSQNYLAVDNAGMVYIMGPVSGGAIQSVGAVSSFADIIYAWQAAQAH